MTSISCTTYRQAPTPLRIGAFVVPATGAAPIEEDGAIAVAPSSPAAVVQERASRTEHAMPRLTYAHRTALAFIAACTLTGGCLGALIAALR